MRRAARRAPALLRDAAPRVGEFLESLAQPDGGFRGRADGSDLYYTAFGLSGLLALGREFDRAAVARYARGFGAGEGLDLAHLACLARVAADCGLQLDDAMRDAILARVGAGITTVNPGGANYSTLYEPTISGIPVTVKRGWTNVYVKVRKSRWFNLVNTHLESFGDPTIREAQALELVDENGPLNTRLPGILVGDLNSDDNTVEGDDRLAYDALIGAGLRDRGTEQPMSCCIKSDLLGPGYGSTDDFDHHIDQIQAILRTAVGLGRDHTDRLDLKITNARAGRAAGVHQVARDLGLAVNDDRLAHERLEVDPVPLAVRGDLDAVMDEALAVQASRDVGLLDGLALAGHVEFGAERDVQLTLAPDHRREHLSFGHLVLRSSDARRVPLPIIDRTPHGVPRSGPSPRSRRLALRR